MVHDVSLKDLNILYLLRSEKNFTRFLQIIVNFEAWRVEVSGVRIL